MSAWKRRLRRAERSETGGQLRANVRAAERKKVRTLSSEIPHSIDAENEKENAFQLSTSEEEGEPGKGRTGDDLVETLGQTVRQRLRAPAHRRLAVVLTLIVLVRLVVLLVVVPPLNRRDRVGPAGGRRGRASRRRGRPGTRARVGCVRAEGRERLSGGRRDATWRGREGDHRAWTGGREK